MQPARTLEAALRERLTEVEPMRRKAVRSGWLKVVGYLVLGALCLTMLAVAAVGSIWLAGNFVTRNMAVIVAVLLASAAGSIYLSVVILRSFSRWRANEEPAYVEQFRRLVIAPVLAQALPQCAVNLEGEIDLARFEASGLFRSRPEHLRTTCGFAAEATGTPFRGSVLQAYRRVYSSERKAHVKVAYLTGVFVHLDLPAAYRSTVRLADARVYEGWDKDRWGVERREAAVQTRSGIPEFDADSIVVLDQDENAPPPVPEAVYRAFLQIRQLAARPIFLSLNRTGVYLAIANEQNRLPLEERLLTPNQPEELAAELDLVSRTVQAVRILREALP